MTSTWPPCGLVAERRELVGVVPVEMTRGGLRAHVAFGVERVVVAVLADLHDPQAIAARRHRELAGEPSLLVAMFESQQGLRNARGCR